LDTIRVVFQENLLARGLWDVGGERVDPTKWTKGALLTLEGEKDDISGLGQTQAAQDLCSRLPENHKIHREIEGVGHYGLFSGHRWRSDIYPIIRDFIHSHD
jgi:poly(3-hydroxybutyrate) depolymerase